MVANPQHLIYPPQVGSRPRFTAAIWAVGTRLRLGITRCKLETGSAPGEEFQTTSQGNPRTAFRRALEYGNVVVAEIEARDVGRLDLLEALDLTALIAERDQPRS